MKISDIIEFAAPPQEVLAMFADEEFQNRKCVATGALRHTVSITTRGERTLIVSTRAMPSDRFPSYVKSMVGETLAEFNGEEDHVHLLVQYPPKVALSHLVNSLEGVSSRRLRQEFVGRVNRSAMRGRFWAPSYFAGSCGGAPQSTVKDYITNQERPD